MTKNIDEMYLSHKEQKLIEMINELQKDLDRYEKVAKAAKDMSERLQTLPWFRSDGGKDAPYCLNHQVWDDWNYGECEQLISAVQEIINADN